MGAFDSALVIAGEFGPYQRRLYFLLCLLCLTTGVSAVVVVIVVAEPSHRCAIPLYTEDSYNIQDDYHNDVINQTVPLSMSRGRLSYDPCVIYNSTQYNSTIARGNNSQVLRCERWVYDKTHFESTAVSEMNLVCERKYLRSHIKMAFMLGKTVGVVILSVFSDLFGRKKLMILSMALSVVSGFASAWVQNTILLSLSLAFLGASNAGVYSAIFVIGMEVTGPKKRFYAGTILDFFFAAGECLVAGVGYLLRDRNITLTVLIIPNALLLPFLLLVPESPRWLLQKGRRKEAVKILEKLAKVNDRRIDEKTMGMINEEHDNKESIWAVLRAWRATWRFLFIFINWFCVSLVFYGLSLHSMDTIGNPYLNLFLFSLMEFPAYMLDMLLLKFVGRRVVMCIAMCFSGLACICTLFPIVFQGSHSSNAILALELVGKFGAAMAFTTLYTFTSELIPTTIRSRGIGASATFARIGGVIAPYIIHLEEYVSGPIGIALPMLVYGGVSICAGLLNICLPETKDRPMPENISDLKTTMRPRKTRDTAPRQAQEFPLL